MEGIGLDYDKRETMMTKVHYKYSTVHNTKINAKAIEVEFDCLVSASVSVSSVQALLFLTSRENGARLRTRVRRKKILEGPQSLELLVLVDESCSLRNHNL